MGRLHPLTSELEYNLDNLANAMRKRLELDNNVAISRALEVPPWVISKTRGHQLPVAVSILIRIHALSN